MEFDPIESKRKENFTVVLSFPNTNGVIFQRCVSKTHNIFEDGS